MEQYWAMAEELLRGAYDLHAHSSPSHIDRSVHDYQMVQQAQDAGMAGIMIKNHYESTVGRAEAINQTKKFTAKAYGGLVLNWPAGGLNPYAVQSALQLGGRFIWLPTRDADNCLKFGDMPGDFFRRAGIKIIDGQGKLRKEIYEIFDLVHFYGAVLATGHVGMEEAVLVCREGRKRGISMVLTHPEWRRTVVPASVQRELAELGVKIEKNWANVEDGDCTLEEMAWNIRTAGLANVYLATDRGQSGKEVPVEGMKKFICALLKSGFSPAEIRDMVQKVPEELVGEVR